MATLQLYFESRSTKTSPETCTVFGSVGWLPLDEVTLESLVVFTNVPFLKDQATTLIESGRSVKYRETRRLRRDSATVKHSTLSIPQIESRHGFIYDSYKFKGSVDTKLTPNKFKNNSSEIADDGLIQLNPIRQSEFSKKISKQYIDGKYRHVVRELIANPELLYAAYTNIMESVGNPPKDDPVQMALDNVGFDWFVRTAKEIREGTFSVLNNCQHVMVKQATRNDHCLRIPNLRLKIVLEAIRSVLQEIYEPQFSYMSHGFRNGRGRHTALRQIKSLSKGTSWWIKFDIHKQFDHENFDILLIALQETIQDHRLFDLLRQIFDAGVFELDVQGDAKQYQKENILSPVLINVYFDILDKKVCQMQKTLEMISTMPKDCLKHNANIRSAPNADDESDYRAVIVEVPIKVAYCRYFNEILCAVDGPKQVASTVKDELTTFLKSKLCIDVKSSSSLLVHASSGQVQFLGIDLQFVPVSRLPLVKIEEKVSVVRKAKHRVKVLAMQQRLHWELGLRKIGSKAMTSIVEKSRNPDSGNKFLDKKVMDTFDLISHKSLQLKESEVSIDALHEKRGDKLLTPLIRKQLPSDLVEAYDNFQSKAAKYLEMRTFKPSGQAGCMVKSITPSTEVVDLQEHKLQIFAPMNQLVEKLHLRGIVDKGGRPVHFDLLISQADSAIIQWYSSLAVTLLDFFRCCDNFTSVKEKVDYHIRMSCLRTLAAKHKSTAYNVTKKFSGDLTTHFPTKAVLHSLGKMFLLDPKPVDDALSVVLTKISKETRHSKTCAAIGCSSKHIELYLVRTQNTLSCTIKDIDSRPLHFALDRKGLPLCEQHYVSFLSGRIGLHNIRLHFVGGL